MGPPPDKETIQQAQERIKKTASSKDCDTVNELNPISRPAMSTDERCKFLQSALDDPVNAAQYEDGGVIEYKVGDATINALMVRDSDGLFHVTYLDPRVPESTIGTKLAPQFDQVANDAVDALRKGDCEAFTKVAFVEFGAGAGDHERVCAYVSNVPLAKLLQKDPNAKPKLMGGNGTFAFYGLSLPGAFWTMILGKETPEDKASKDAPKLPADAPTYGYIDAFRTNTANPSDSP